MDTVIVFRAVIPSLVSLDTAIDIARTIFRSTQQRKVSYSVCVESVQEISDVVESFSGESVVSMYTKLIGFDFISQSDIYVVFGEKDNKELLIIGFLYN